MSSCARTVTRRFNGRLAAQSVPEARLILSLSVCPAIVNRSIPRVVPTCNDVIQPLEAIIGSGYSSTCSQPLRNLYLDDLVIGTIVLPNLRCRVWLIGSVSSNLASDVAYTASDNAHYDIGRLISSFSDSPSTRTESSQVST